MDEDEVIADQCPCPASPAAPGDRNGDERGPNWNTFLSSAAPQDLQAVAPVTYFEHALLGDVWEDFTRQTIGSFIELPNPYIETDSDDPVMWIARVEEFAGYKALVSFERFGVEPNHFAWITICSSLPKRLGFSLKNDILLYPMVDIAQQFPNYVEKILTDVLPNCGTLKTLPRKHAKYIKKKIMRAQERYPLMSKVEVLDTLCLSRVRIATVTAHIGDLVHITFDFEPKPNDTGFIFSVHSDLIHPIGWAKAVGMDIIGPIEPITPFTLDCIPAWPENISIRVGQTLEARHPLDPYAICSAVVDVVLKHGYFMAAFRTSPEEKKTPLRYCFHVTSPYIFPVGFCKRNKILLWRSNKKQSGSPAPLHRIPPRPPHKFVVGSKFEAMDINDPGFLGPVTVTTVAEHMLLLRYEGWPTTDPSSLIWTSADSSNIFPLGYAELIGFKFQEP